MLMSFPLLLPLWRDVRVRRGEKREQKSVWVGGGPQLHVTLPSQAQESGVSLAPACPCWGRVVSTPAVFGLKR